MIHTLAVTIIAAAAICESPSDLVEVSIDGKVSHFTIIYQMTGECGAMIEIAPETDSPLVAQEPRVEAKPKKRVQKKRKRCKPGRWRNAKGICGRWG